MIASRDVFQSLLENDKALIDLNLDADMTGQVLYDSDICELAEVLAHNHFLKVLNISHAYITQAGAMALAECLEKKHTLEILIFGPVIHFEHDSVVERAFEKALLENSTIRDIIGFSTPKMAQKLEQNRYFQDIQTEVEKRLQAVQHALAEKPQFKVFDSVPELFLTTEGKGLFLAWDDAKRCRSLYDAHDHMLPTAIDQIPPELLWNIQQYAQGHPQIAEALKANYLSKIIPEVKQASFCTLF